MAQHCTSFAERSIFHPWRQAGQINRVMFVCRLHLDLMMEKIPGIDRPEYADDDWRPSLIGMMKLGEAKLSFDDLRRHPVAPATTRSINMDAYWRGFYQNLTPAQQTGMTALIQGVRTTTRPDRAALRAREAGEK